MKGFLLGLLVAALAFGGFLWWKSRENTEPKPTAAAADAGAPGKKKRKRGRGAARMARAKERPPGDEAEYAEPDPEPIKISAADRKMVAQGDNLSAAEVTRLDLSDTSNARELTQDDIDEGFRAREDDILGCISRSRPDAEAYIPGLVTVKFRIQKTGAVRGVRVEAPAILQKGGIYGCVKSVVEGIRFPQSGSSQIVTYPFRLS
ncbi:MAG TPA: hypothetical protein VGF45_03840 [Polyangia bacterium]